MTDIATLRAFLDESGSGGDSRYFVLSGYMAPLPIWEEFAEAWKTVRDAEPKIDYFKMSEAESLKHQFQGFTVEQRDAKLKAFIKTILSYPLFEASIALPMDLYEEMLAFRVPKRFRNPYFFCFSGMLSLLPKFAELAASGQKVEFVFDSQQELQRRADQLYLKLADFPPFRDRVASVDFRDDKILLPLQAADLIAWQVRRFLCAKGEGRRRELEELRKDKRRWYSASLGRRDLEDAIALSSAPRR